MMTAILVTVATILATVPASNPDGRIMSPQESQTAALAPTRFSFYGWDADGIGLLSRRPATRTWRLPVPESKDISYGMAVSRNEFNCSEGVFPSNGGDLLAVYRKDESRVSDFPLLDITTRTGTLRSIKYPMNGMPSELLSLCVCDTLGNVRATLAVDDFDEERYLTNVSWSADDKYIFVHVLDRAQHHMHLNMYRSADGSFVRTVLTEENDAWYEPQDPLRPLKSTGDYIYRTDNRDGYRSLYLCDTLGYVRRITTCEADVEYAGCDDQWIYYTSAEVSSVENHLFRVSYRKGRTVAGYKFGKPQQLTTGSGWHTVYLNPQCTRFVDVFSSLDVPRIVTMRAADGTAVEELVNSPDPLADYARCEVEFGTVKSADGQFDNYYRFIKPLNYDPDKKYPLIVYVYGGPHSQMVRNSWLGSIRMWEMAMAQRGYAVYVQDNRGTSNRGAAFEKAINRRCGQAEAADQMAGLDALLERCPWIDAERIGVHGWSYGGFMTITLLTHHPDVFKVAVAGGPVIDWKWYEIMYGERYMDTPETNPEGFEVTSLMNQTKNVRGRRLLICQGAIDDTVVWEHSLSFVDKCIVEGVQLDYFPYPTSKHNMSGAARFHLYDKISDYFLRNL